MTTDAQPRLHIEELRRARAAARIGCTIEYCESVDSTNTRAYQLASAGAFEGTVVIAETQTRGRGRLGRAWVSPAFCNLYLSVVLRPPIAATVAPQIGLVIGVATAETVREWAAGAVIKWPNDILIDGRKVAGILTEMDVEHDRVRFVIAGVGVNLNSTPGDFPPDVRDKAVALALAAGKPIDRTAFSARLLSRLEERYGDFLRDGFAAVRPLWERLSCLTGRQVCIDDGNQRHEGIVAGVADDGALQLRDAAGREIRVVAGDVTVIDGYEPSAQQSALSSQLKEGES
jgi:BirA family biotin operon repressor/biotin-[acetyl-CoA-carboxylase] ligase